MRSSTPIPSMWPRLVRLAALAVFAAAVFAVVASVRQSDQERLAALAEFSLFYPGSVVIREGGSGAAGGYPADKWRRLRTDASTESVLAFYLAELTKAGWATGGGSAGARTTSETKACAWHTDDRILRLSFWDMDKFVKRYPTQTGFVMVYELRLINQGGSSDTKVCHPS